MYFYKDSNNWVIGKTVSDFTPSGNFRLIKNGIDNISVISTDGKMSLISATKVTDIAKDSSGSKYASLQEFIEATRDFFVNPLNPLKEDVEGLKLNKADLVEGKVPAEQLDNAKKIFMHKFVNDNTGYPHTGSVGETVVKTIVIPANYLKPDSVIWFNLLTGWTNNSNQKAFYVRINGNQVLAYAETTSTKRQFYFPVRLKEGKAFIAGSVGSGSHTGFGVSSLDGVSLVDFGGVENEISITFSVSLANAADSASFDSINIIIEP